MSTITKKISTNSKEVKEAIRKHILECVHDYDTEENFTELHEAKKYLYAEFERVANYPVNIHNIPNEQNRFKDFMQGCVFWFEFEDYKIEQFLNSIGITKQFKADEAWNLYAYLIFRELKK